MHNSTTYIIGSSCNYTINTIDWKAPDVLVNGCVFLVLCIVTSITVVGNILVLQAMVKTEWVQFWYIETRTKIAVRNWRKFLRDNLTGNVLLFVIHFIPWLLCYKLWRSIMVTRWCLHDDVDKWRHFPRYWPFERGIHRSPVNSLHKGKWRRALMLFLSAPEKRLSKQSRGWWFETPSRPLWHHCNEYNKKDMGADLLHIETAWAPFTNKD